MAARSLIGLFRKINPSLLKKIDRGKDSKEVAVKEFGQIDIVNGKVEQSDDEIDGDGPEDDSDAMSVDEEDLSGDEEEMEDDEEEELDIDDVNESDLEDHEVMKVSKGKGKNNGGIKEAEKGDESDSDSDSPEYLDRGVIEKYGKKKKNSYDERVAAHKSGTEGNLYGSKKGRKAPGQSTTNKEKAKKKNQLMVVKSFAMRDRKRMSLREKQKQLRGNGTKKKSNY
jgi:protein SDA1